jgi:hypothetical protein
MMYLFVCLHGVALRDFVVRMLRAFVLYLGVGSGCNNMYLARAYNLYFGMGSWKQDNSVLSFVERR